MTIGQMFAAELEHEAVATRKMLERMPDGDFDWQPHAKSMRLGQLASHVADVPNWIRPTVTTEELDFAQSNWQPKEMRNAADLVNYFDQGLSDALEVLRSASDADLMKNWRLRNGENIFFEMPRAQVLRSMVMNHLIHHRGQLSVYLRLKDVPLPGAYGPSADEQTM